MKVYVGVTDTSWYRFLQERPYLDEVNFWRPSGGKVFQAIQVGEPFFFKSHSPHNQIVGGGLFSGFVPLSISEAWSHFEEGNGTGGLQEMRDRISLYRKRPLSADEDPVIGCILVRDVRFFREAPYPPPPDFAKNIVQGKSYDLDDLRYWEYFKPVLDDLSGLEIEVDVESWHRKGPVYGDPRPRPQRLGQRSFQAVVLNAYERRCAITGTRIRPVLQAAHIRPLPRGGEHRLDNGLLLRSDVHTLYDRGYLGIDPSYRLLVSSRLRAEFGDGEEFYSRAGQQLAVLPRRANDRPHRDFLEWHLAEVFRAG